MDTYARSLPPNVKVVLMMKLREYISDPNNLKSEIKRIASSNLNKPTQDELLQLGMADATVVCMTYIHQFIIIIFLQLKE